MKTNKSTSGKPGKRGQYLIIQSCIYHISGIRGVDQGAKAAPLGCVISVTKWLVSLKAPLFIKENINVSQIR